MGADHHRRSIVSWEQLNLERKVQWINATGQVRNAPFGPIVPKYSFRGGTLPDGQLDWQKKMNPSKSAIVSASVAAQANRAERGSRSLAHRQYVSDREGFRDRRHCENISTAELMSYWM